MISIYLADVILLTQDIFSKITHKKSWLKQMDENLSEYEMIREGW